MSGNVGHQFLAADVYLDGVIGWHHAFLEEGFDVGKGFAHIFYIIFHGAVESGTGCVLGYHGDGRDVRLDKAAAQGGKAHLKQQYQHTGQYKAPP